ncbi:MBL fold metallo-hydrolase [Alkalicella caledoniensis]|uniref:MBL fold metallo-hydrolase n=1 Tax=Alkalicella caledoniensis TaxID=2731377 RepID=A0A7G9W6N8_ALKCA|nr:MBL fold metallo-hydrolase [Alkalicella caledoniensis]QNO14350.1 MBL fold metallo-hydrolase [Alkalicella caledoniensis]
MFKDYLLNRNLVRFSIDEISHYKERDFLLKIIPNINSEFFPPFHLRYIRVADELLQKEFLNAQVDYNYLVEKSIGSVVQGGYYSIPQSTIRGQNIFAYDEYRFDIKNDIFADNRVESPFNDLNISVDYNRNPEDIKEPLFCQQGKLDIDCPYIYCFNVGQGDSFLAITSVGNAYIIDTNVYSRNNANRFCSEIKHILGKHKLDTDKIKGLIITHKHLDHLRGAKYIIDRGLFDIEYFIINQDYHHPTKTVSDLLKSAKSIPKWINLNRPCKFKEGNTVLEFVNPDSRTSTNVVSPDINDSSICFTLGYHNTSAHLTGDIGYNHLLGKMKAYEQSILKVSHHGSRTGTNKDLLDEIKPQFAFVSAGNHKGFKHPHTEIDNLLKANVSSYTLSKKVKQTTYYKLDGSKIKKSYI